MLQNRGKFISFERGTTSLLANLYESPVRKKVNRSRFWFQGCTFVGASGYPAFSTRDGVRFLFGSIPTQPPARGIREGCSTGKKEQVIKTNKEQRLLSVVEVSDEETRLILAICPFCNQRGYLLGQGRPLSSLLNKLHAQLCQRLLKKSPSLQFLH